MAQAVHAALATTGGAASPSWPRWAGPTWSSARSRCRHCPSQKILPALEIQHRELGLLPPGDAVLDAQVLRRAHDGVLNEILSVSVPRARIDERMRLLELAGVDIQILDVEPLALLNGAMRLTALDQGELLVLLTIGRQRSVLCLYSEQGPVVARYLSAGAETFLDQLRDVVRPGRGRGGRTRARCRPPRRRARRPPVATSSSASRRTCGCR